MSLKEKEERDAVLSSLCQQEGMEILKQKSISVVESAGYKKREYYCSYTEGNVRG